MIITVYVHSTKESAWDAGKKAGLSESQLSNFKYAGYEHRMEYEVDEEGCPTLVSVDGRRLLA